MNTRLMTALTLVLGAAFVLAGCDSPITTPAASSEKAITSFAVLSPAVKGTINGTAHTIAVTVPYGTDVTALVPTIAHSGASVSPASGVAQDFTDPVTYTVTAADGSTQRYTVTVTVDVTPPSSTKMITSFGFATPAASGTVSETDYTIALTVPKGTDVKALAPTIEHTGASISPASGVAQDFTDPVTYTVTAADGSTQAYVVTVTVAGFTVTYLGEGNTGGAVPDEASYAADQSFSLAVNSGSLVKNGYTFLGWSTDDADGFKFYRNQAVTLPATKNYVFHAVWLDSHLSGDTSASEGIWIWNKDGDPSGDLVIPKGVECLGVSMAGNDGITSVTLPSTLKRYLNRAPSYVSGIFNGCIGITKVTLEAGFSTPNTSMFSGCSGITTVVIPSGVTDIGDMFSDCFGLHSVSLPKTITSASFKDCTRLTDVSLEDGIPTVPANLLAGCVSIAKVTIPTSVKEIGSGAFSGCSKLSTIDIPSSVTTIGKSAFEGCTELTEVTIPSSVTAIGESAFEGCTGLTSVTIPSSVTKIDTWAFKGCTNLKSVVIGSSEIGKEAFSGCANLTTVTLSDSVKTIGEYAFSACAGITGVSLSSNLTTIGDNAFYGCSGLTSVSIPVSVITIGKSAFANCAKLSTVTLPAGLTCLGESMFANCSKITSVTIPSSITKIGASAFSSCTGLTSITLTSGLTTIGVSMFSGCKALGSVTIPSSVTDIGESAFNGCTGLTSVTLTSGLKTIGACMFMGCSALTSVTIPASVTSIMYSAFYKCSLLATVICNPTEPPVLDNYNAFTNCSSSLKIKVPSSSVTGYKGAGQWSSISSSIVSQ